jgi:rhodanese-related sulfurtransferase
LQEHFSPKLFVADFVTLVKEGRVAVLVFDVRSAEEWKACHLEGSINIAPSAVDMKGVAQLRKKKPIIVVIAPEGLEYQLPNLLVKAGIPRVAYLSGGMDALLAISADCIKIVRG